MAGQAKMITIQIVLITVDRIPIFLLQKKLHFSPTQSENTLEMRIKKHLEENRVTSHGCAFFSLPSVKSVPSENTFILLLIIMTCNDKIQKQKIIDKILVCPKKAHILLI
jgi:hypothetical protein